MARRPPHRVHKIDAQISEQFNKKKDGHDDHNHHRHHHFAKLPSIPTAGIVDENDDYRSSELELWAQEEIKSGHRSKRGLGLFHGQHKENLPDYHYHDPPLHHHHPDHPDHTNHEHHGQNPFQRYRSLPHLHLHGEVPSADGRDSARSQHHQQQQHHHHSSVVAPVSLFPKRPDALPFEDEMGRSHDHSAATHFSRREEKQT